VAHKENARETATGSPKLCKQEARTISGKTVTNTFFLSNFAGLKSLRHFEIGRTRQRNITVPPLQENIFEPLRMLKTLNLYYIYPTKMSGAYLEF